MISAANINNFRIGMSINAFNKITLNKVIIAPPIKPSTVLFGLM